MCVYIASLSPPSHSRAHKFGPTTRIQLIKTVRGRITIVLLLEQDKYRQTCMAVPLHRSTDSSASERVRGPWATHAHSLPLHLLAEVIVFPCLELLKHQNPCSFMSEVTPLVLPVPLPTVLPIFFHPTICSVNKPNWSAYPLAACRNLDAAASTDHHGG